MMEHDPRRRPLLRRRKVLLGAAGLLAAAAGVSGGSAAFQALAEQHGLRPRTRAGLAFGTTVSLTLAGPDERAADAALADGFRAMRRVEAAASLFRSDSALARLNRDGVLVDPDPTLLALMRFALDLAHATDGAFDPSVQPLWTLWAGATAGGGCPSDAELSETVRRIDWRAIAVSEEAIRFARPGMGVTLNALIQGLAADCVMAAIDAHGISDAFIDTGEFGARGAHADGTPWRLGIADPRAPNEVADTIEPFAGFAATSGDYAMSFSSDHADHHIFDPKTGRSPRALSSVTVTAPSGLLADGLSTAAFVLGEAGGTRLVAAHPGCALRAVRKSAPGTAT